MRLGFILQEYCYQKHITAKDFADQFGCSQSTISRFFKGEKIDSDTLVKILAWVLAVDIMGGQS